jgi:hypothetical protein
VKFDWQRPPLLLGLVLGGIAENNLFIATRIYGASWLMHPGVIVIGLLMLIGLLYPLYDAWRRRAKREPGNFEPIEPQSAEKIFVPISRKTRIARALFALFFVALFAYVVYEAKFGFGAWEPRAALFPWVIGLPGLLLAIYVLIRDATQNVRPVKLEEAQSVSEPEIDPILARQRTIAIIGWMVGFFAAIWLLGFTATAAVATFLYLKFGAKERWPVAVGLAFVAWLFFYGLFDYGLQLPFPVGAVFEWVHIDLPAVRSIFLASG